MHKGKLLYSGKAKSIYATDDQQLAIIDFRNDISAFNAEKLAQLTGKGTVNNSINAYLMDFLNAKGIKTHHVKRLNATEALVRRLEMIPIECVVRNQVAGSLAKRFALTEGTPLSQPVFEFYLKDDALGDPFINASHIRTFAWASAEEMTLMEQISLQINGLLTPLFADAQMLLVDYKLEFGRLQGQLYLADEMTPDGCRIWDATTQEKFDKDRFRRDLGDVVAHYRIVAERLGVVY